MYIKERAVTKYYWMRMYRYLFRKLQRGEYRAVPGSKMLQVNCGQRCTSYCAVVEHNGELRPVAWLYLWQKPGWAAWEVMQVYVFDKLRGLGLAKKLYQAAINGDNLMVISGTSHTSHSQALWKSFIKKRTFKIWAHDVRNLTRRSDVFYEPEHDDLFCLLDIYGPYPATKQDVRFVALRK